MKAQLLVPKEVSERLLPHPFSCLNPKHSEIWPLQNHWGGSPFFTQKTCLIWIWLIYMDFEIFFEPHANRNILHWALAPVLRTIPRSGILWASSFENFIHPLLSSPFSRALLRSLICKRESICSKVRRRKEKRNKSEPKKYQSSVRIEWERRGAKRNKTE